MAGGGAIAPPGDGDPLAWLHLPRASNAGGPIPPEAKDERKKGVEGSRGEVWEKFVSTPREKVCWREDGGEEEEDGCLNGVTDS